MFLDEITQSGRLFAFFEFPSQPLMPRQRLGKLNVIPNAAC
jgi:hypothetical protein